MTESYRCILIDDELLALAYLRTLCEDIPGITVVKAFDNPEKALQELPQLQVDFCISDIVMPGLSGLELAQQLQGIPVIFTTAHNDYAADAFDIDAADYLRKPVQPERLRKAVEKVVQLLSLREPRDVILNLHTHKGKMQLPARNLLVVSSNTADRRDKLATLRSGEEWILKHISYQQLLELLPERDFCRISKSELIAIGEVTGYSGDIIYTSIRAKDGTLRQFTLGDPYRKHFLALLRK